VYSGIIPISECLIEEELHGGTYSLEPARILDRLPPVMLDLDIPLVVRIKDNSSEIEMNLQAFLTRSYRVRNGKVRIGVMRFQLSELVISCGLKFLIQDVSSITENRLD
jgi:hypothetical protein